VYSISIRTGSIQGERTFSAGLRAGSGTNSCQILDKRQDQMILDARQVYQRFAVWPIRFILMESKQVLPYTAFNKRWKANKGSITRSDLPA
jgi:hypothetical protein